jgi:hypothetical protein
MKTIFFNFPVNTPKIAFTHSDKTVKQLKGLGVIDKDAAYVEYPLIDENSSREELSLIGMPDYLQFDNENNPTAVVFDMELIEVYILDLVRSQRSIAFNYLDNIQMRAMVRGRQSVVEAAEADKEILRNMPDEIDLSSATDYWTAYESVPNYLIDFQEKYKADLA